MNAHSFKSTRWTLVHRVGTCSEVGARAMSELCEIYYEPVRQFIARTCRHEGHGRDLTHAFFEQLLEKNSLGQPNPQQGKFRSYLLGAVKHFLSSEQTRKAALKRGGDHERVELDESILGAPDNHRTFDKDWAFALISRAHDSLAQAMKATNKDTQFKILKPWLDGGQNGNSAEASAQLGLSANAFKVAVHRLRSKFRQCVREEIEATTHSPLLVEEEFSYLIEILTD